MEATCYIEARRKRHIFGKGVAMARVALEDVDAFHAWFLRNEHLLDTFTENEIKARLLKLHGWACSTHVKGNACDDISSGGAYIEILYNVHESATQPTDSIRLRLYVAETVVKQKKLFGIVWRSCTTVEHVHNNAEPFSIAELPWLA